MADTQTVDPAARDAARQPASPGVIASLFPSDASAAAAFYVRAFGAEELARMPAQDGKRLMHCNLRINGGTLFLSDVFPESGYTVQAPQGFSLTMIVDDLDAWWTRAIDAGATPVMAPQKMFWGDRYAQLKDPFGYLWAMNQPA